MSINYTAYVGPYFYCSEESYTKWISGEDLRDDFYDFYIFKLGQSESVVFVPDVYNWGVNLDPQEGPMIRKIDSLPNDEITKLNDAYQSIIPLLPEGITTHYGLVTWWG